MKKIFISFLILLCLLPSIEATSQTETIIGLGKQILKWGDTVANLSDKVQTASEIKSLIESLACAKYKFDKYRETKAITSCIGNTNITLIDVEYSTLYREVYSMTKLLSNPSAMDDSQVSNIMQKIRSLIEKISSLNEAAEEEFLEQQRHKEQINFTTSVLSSSF